MSRMGSELLLCVGVFAALSVYESLRVAYHRQLEGNRRAKVPVPTLARTSFWGAFWKVVLRLIGIFSGLFLYEKLCRKYHWRLRATRRLSREQQIAPPTGRMMFRADQMNSATDSNRFAVASQRPMGKASRIQTDAYTTGEDHKNG